MLGDEGVQVLGHKAQRQLLSSLNWLQGAFQLVLSV